MNLLIAIGLIKIFFGGSSTILAGVIAFLGAIIGGALTLIGVKWTLVSQSEKEDMRRFESSKTYLSASKTIFNYNGTDKIGRLEKHRLMLTESFKSLNGLNEDIAYYSVIRYGGDEVVTNCQIVVTVGTDNSFLNSDTIESWTDYFEKDEEIIIPICSLKLKETNPWVKEIKVTFYTLNNDKIVFTQSELDNKRNHIFYQGDKKQTLGVDTKYTAWTQKGKNHDGT